MSSSEKVRPPTVRDVELAKIGASERKWVEGFKFGASVSRYLAIVASVYLIIKGLDEIVLSKPDHINALSRLVESFRLGEGLLAVIAAVSGVGWYRERKGKKRMTELKGKYQKQLESGDPERSTSGLLLNGNSPEEDK